MKLLLENKTTVITGSSRGIGAATAKLLAHYGANVIVNYHNHRKAGQQVVESILKNGGQAIIVQADVTKSKDIQKLLRIVTKQYSHIDIWVNNVSEYTSPKLVKDATWDEYLKEWEGAVKSTLLCSQAVIPIMQQQKYGRIINLVSTLVTRPASGYSAHATAKSALLGLTRSMAKELGKDGITVNMVSPGMTLTEDNLKIPLKIRKSITEKTPTRKLATPEDIAGAILFFASDLSKNITGAYLAVDGGLSLP